MVFKVIYFQTFRKYVDFGGQLGGAAQVKEKDSVKLVAIAL